MQRRAAAVYVTLFLVIAAGSYAFIGAAQQPAVGLDEPDRSLTLGEERNWTTFSVGGRTYNLTSVGGGSAEASWTNESARYTAQWDNNTTVEFQGTTYRALVPNRTDPSSVTLREVQNLTENTSTVTHNGTEMVVVTRNGSQQLVPVEEYKRQQFGAPQTRNFSEGDTVQYRNNSTTVGNITNSAVPLSWTAPQTNSVSFEQGQTVDLGPNDRTFVAHFPDGNTLQLSTDVDAYRDQQAAVDEFNERIAGLWGVSILSFLTATLLAGLAYLPVRS